MPDPFPSEPRATPSPSGHGWTDDGMYPFFPGTPCVHCGRFVGRDGIFNVETFEMSNEIASMDAEHRNCEPPIAQQDRENFERSLP